MATRREGRLKVLRDTGSSCCVVRAALVEGHRRTGDVREYILIDGTERQFETVRVHVQTPYYEGELECLVMRNPLCDPITGNVEGAEEQKDPSFPVSLGFSPFEMLYSRTVRGPITILRELWTKQEEKEEVKTSYQYAMDLQNRLEETCKFAKESLAVTAEPQRRHFNKKARKRQLEVGDRALLLPTDHNKLLMQ